ncbi:MAG: MogA/MoaB family molybdenum cofactor biosynthesis protein [Gemmatimonadota bacterium]|nr:MAG: MogA/MoaB family molybdenum cofactor biosynthesis protein [Gemmatimonadota bacterium]
MSVRVAVLTVSDRGEAGRRRDTSGDALADWVERQGYQLSGREIVPDETDLIAAVLVRWADDRVADLIITTGGTGLGPRDVTPEATRAVLEREAPGIAEALRADGRDNTPYSVLSRGTAGIRGATLIVNLPGGTSGVRDGIITLSPIVEHAARLLRGELTEH